MDIPEYEVTLLLLTEAGVTPITLGADQVRLNPAEMAEAVAHLAPGSSLLYVNPGPALSLSVSRLSEAQRGARAAPEYLAPPRAEES